MRYSFKIFAYLKQVLRDMAQAPIVGSKKFSNQRWLKNSEFVMVYKNCIFRSGYLSVRNCYTLVKQCYKVRRNG